MINERTFTNIPRILCLSLRLESSKGNDTKPDNSDNDVIVSERTKIITVYDCNYNDAPSDKRGDTYRHYYIRDYIGKNDTELYSRIDSELKVCFSEGVLYYADRVNKMFRRLENRIYIYDASLNDSHSIIGTLEEMNITM